MSLFGLFSTRGTLEFSACQDLKNPWNDNKPVKISRDGQVSVQCDQHLSKIATSLSPRPKTNPSMDYFQYHARALYWKWYTRRMRSGDESRYLHAACGEVFFLVQFTAKTFQEILLQEQEWCRPIKLQVLNSAL